MANEKTTRQPMPVMMQVRVLHTYIGMLVAPTVLFFAFTGILQIYNFHEDRPGYTPPPLIEKLGRVHKDQVFAPDEHHGPPPGAEPKSPEPKPAEAKSAGPSPADGDHDHAAPKGVTLLKAYFAIVAAGLILSTAFGIWMGVRRGPRQKTNLVLLAVGVIVPIVLIAMTA